MQNNKVKQKSGLSFHFFLIGLVFILGAGFLGAQEKSSVKKEYFKKMLLSAVTAQDHRAIAAVYAQEAQEARAKAEEHRAMAAWYKRRIQINKISISIKDPGHCKRLVRIYTEQAQTLDELARTHEDIARQLED